MGAAEDASRMRRGDVAKAEKFSGEVDCGVVGLARLRARRRARRRVTKAVQDIDPADLSRPPTQGLLGFDVRPWTPASAGVTV